MTVKVSEISSVVITPVIEENTACSKLQANEVKNKNPSETEGVNDHPRYSFKEMVDCLRKVGHSTKWKKNCARQHDDSCYGDINIESEHQCFKIQNNNMQKSQQNNDPGSAKQNEMLPSSTEHNCVEKTEKPLNAWQRRDSFSSCSSDSAVYCSTRHTQFGVPEEPVRIFPCENSHVDPTCDGKRQRHSSGSSVISIASDASCKETEPGLGKKNIMSSLSASPKISETDTSDISKSPLSVSHVRKTKSASVHVSKLKKDAVQERNSETEALKKTSQTPPPAVRLHDLRKNIRRKACCHGDCNETHTTFIVRRYTEAHASNSAHQHPSSTLSGKRSAPSSNPPSLESSPVSSKKRKKSEIDILFAALHEIKWAKHFSPETILQQSEARRASGTTKLSNATDNSSLSALSCTPLSKTRGGILKSKSPTKTAVSKNKISPEIEKVQESFCVKNRPNIHILNTDNQQLTKANVSSPKTSHRGSWLSKRKKLFEMHDHQQISPKVLYNDSAEQDKQDHTDISGTDNSGVSENVCAVDKRNSPIFLQIAAVSNEDSTTSPRNQSNVLEKEYISRIVSCSASNPQFSNVEHKYDLGSDLCANAQSTVICARDNATLHVPVCELQDSSFPLEYHELNATELVKKDCSLLTPLSQMSSTLFKLESSGKESDMSTEMQSQETLTDNDDESCNESDVFNTKDHSGHNESFELPLLSSESSPVKDAPFSETPPVLEPCISLPAVQQSEEPLQPPVSSLYSSLASDHLAQEFSAVKHESNSEKSHLYSSEELFVTHAKAHETLVQSTEREDYAVKEVELINQTITASEFSPSSCSSKDLGYGNRSEPKACNVSISKRASRLILKKYVMNSRRKTNNYKNRDSAWTGEDDKMWRCIVVESDEERDSDEENQISELFNCKATSPDTVTETVNCSGFANNYEDDMRTSTSKTNCEYHKQSVCDGAFSPYSNKLQGSFCSSSYIVQSNHRIVSLQNVKNVAHTSSSFQAAHKKHGKPGKSLQLKEKVNCKKLKKLAVTGRTSDENKNSHAERKELSQEVIKLKMLYGFTFHYKGITVNKNDSYTQVILKLTTSKNIFLSVEALTELKDTLNSAGNDSNCQVLIINGIGNSFCSGLDLRPLMGPRKKDSAKEMAVAVKEFIEALASFHKPLVSVVNGSAMGLGVTLLTYSDVVLASDTASFHMPYTQLGYMPEGAVTLTLPQVMGSTVAMDMLLRGRKISAQEARAHGLVSEVLESKKLPQQLVSRVRILAESPVAAMESTKSMLRWHLYGKLHVALENELQMLPKQWLSPTCQVALKKAFQNGLLSE